MKDIDNDTKVAGVARRNDWEDGWGENLKDYSVSGNLESLTPKFVRKNEPLRLRNNFIIPVTNDNFELDWREILHHWLFEEYFGAFDTIYEFGCGTGYNLVEIAKMYPDKKLVGLDWAESAVKLVNDVAAKNNYNMVGRQFDFFCPDTSLTLDNRSLVFTHGALEQTGEQYGDFINCLLEQKPGLCVFVEPIVEWHNTTNIVEYLGVRFLQKRKYWSGFPNLLGRLAKQGKAQIVKLHRTGFGSLYLEGYNLLVWIPL
jgi:SAM-dependent methyltransferase